MVLGIYNSMIVIFHFFNKYVSECLCSPVYKVVEPNCYNMSRERNKSHNGDGQSYKISLSFLMKYKRKRLQAALITISPSLHLVQSTAY